MASRAAGLAASLAVYAILPSELPIVEFTGFKINILTNIFCLCVCVCVCEIFVGNEYFIDVQVLGVQSSRGLGR